jgi:hypothetical protein
MLVMLAPANPCTPVAEAEITPSLISVPVPYKPTAELVTVPCWVMVMVP